MKKYTQKALKALVTQGKAHDLTTAKALDEWIATHSYTKIGYSAGINGINGCLIVDDKTGEFYAVTARNGNLLRVF